MRYNIIATVEAPSLGEAWDTIPFLPTELSENQLITAVEKGLLGMKIFAIDGRGLVEWRKDEGEA